MSRRRYSEHRHFLALRACWVILRGGSVAYRINFTAGIAEGFSDRETFWADCRANGKPMTAGQIYYVNPEAQEGRRLSRSPAG